MNVRIGSRISGKSRRSGEILAQKLHGEGIRDQRVLQAIAQSPRHIFVPEILAHKATIIPHCLLAKGKPFLSHILSRKCRNCY